MTLQIVTLFVCSHLFVNICWQILLIVVVINKLFTTPLSVNEREKKFRQFIKLRAQGQGPVLSRQEIQDLVGKFYTIKSLYK